MQRRQESLTPHPYSLSPKTDLRRTGPRLLSCMERPSVRSVSAYIIPATPVPLAAAGGPARRSSITYAQICIILCGRWKQWKRIMEEECSKKIVSACAPLCLSPLLLCLPLTHTLSLSIPLWREQIIPEERDLLSERSKLLRKEGVVGTQLQHFLVARHICFFPWHLCCPSGHLPFLEQSSAVETSNLQSLPFVSGILLQRSCKTPISTTFADKIMYIDFHIIYNQLYIKLERHLRRDQREWQAGSVGSLADRRTCFLRPVRAGGKV